jgi:DNA-binding NtrC family response regulator
LQQAEGGTLFLDEIGDLPLPLQVKLLRVLENREYQPLGARRPRKANVRFLAATHQDLESMVRQKLFRQDLYFRLNVVPLRIPALRERSEDIPLLLDMALDRFNALYDKKLRGFTSEALSVLMDHDYPGNIRELLNIVERAAILCRGEWIEPEHLPAGLRTPPLTRKNDDNTSPSSPSRSQLHALLAQCHGNRAAAAQKLGVNRTTLWRWLKRLEKGD